MRTLAVIPARGGSKGIPRKNLRPIGGKPLLGWAIEAARDGGVDTVLVSTDSDEIARVAARFGARVLMRDPTLGADAVTLDPVIHEAVVRLEADGEAYDVIVTIQPTSPLLRPTTVARILRRMETEPVDTILTAVDDTHLAWEGGDAGPVPAYEARVNRQSLPARFRETGGALAARREHVTAGSRIGPRLQLEVLSHLEGIDIDTADDWLIAEAALSQRRIAFVVIGSPGRGLGHVMRVMTLLDCLGGHIARCFCAPSETTAIERLRAAFFPVEVVPREGLQDALDRFGADVVVHDELDTRAEDLLAEKAAGMKVITFEDKGAGLEHADAVFNALYPAEESDPERGIFFGPSVYCLREEFRTSERRVFRDAPERVLVTFGGTDPSGLAIKVLDVIEDGLDVALTVVAGFGYPRYDDLAARVERLRAAGATVDLLQDVKMMSDVMASADIAFTSAGRTLYELAAMGVPSIVLAQNEIEMKHTFASPENGFLFLGLGTDAPAGAIQSAFGALMQSVPLRRRMRELMLGLSLEDGRDRVVAALLED
ncbi:MAG: NTP transferase domain-containing protein [Proteobacteria bacterium]|nr:NTP transferase domain-containing protein [Pseudomonadota bacterium]